METRNALTRVYRFVTRAVIIIPVTGLLMAPTCDQSFNGTAGSSSDPVVQYRAFGDSIPSGNLNSGSSSSTSYVHYYAGDMAAANSWRVSFDAKTIAGETTSAIRSTMLSNTSKMAAADVFTFNGGGNDFLDALDAYGKCGNETTFANTVNNWRVSWDNLINTVATYVPADAAIRTMTIYFPNVNAARNATCTGGKRNNFEVILPYGLAASDYMCSTAEARGWRCADALTVMNCNQDASGNAEQGCPNKAWLASLAAGPCPRGSNGMMDVACIRGQLDAQQNWSKFRDPTSVVKGSSTISVIQSGDIHPNQAGHDRIGAAHHDLGYDDCGACPTPPVPAVCGDNVCNGTETCGTCASDCGVCAAGIDVSNLSVAYNTWSTTYTYTGTNPTFVMSGGTGDADLYVRLGSAPTSSSYNCRPYKVGNNETCSMSGTGTWYIKVYGYSAASGVGLNGN